MEEQSYVLKQDSLVKVEPPSYERWDTFRIEDAVHLLKENEPEKGYYGCFSGGKDSVAIKELASIAKVKVEWHYHKTTIDPPELVQFIKKVHPDVIFDRPKYGNFFNRMVRRGVFPTRRLRWCCDEYKEGYIPPESTAVMGIRSEESANRKKNWDLISRHYRSKALVVNPIFEWSSDELWDFIKTYNISYCSLYDEGFKRLGCIGCPQARYKGRVREFARWPQYEVKWKRAFKKIWDLRTGTRQRNGQVWFGDVFFRNWEEMYNWWLSDRSLPKHRLKDDTQPPPWGAWETLKSL
jgi:phosphoadenosine phosphosulfate reductase